MLKLPLFSSPSDSLEVREENYYCIASVLDLHATIVSRRGVLRPSSPWVGRYERTLRSELRKLEGIARASTRKRDWRKFKSARLAF